MQINGIQSKLKQDWHFRNERKIVCLGNVAVIAGGQPSIQAIDCKEE